MGQLPALNVPATVGRKALNNTVPGTAAVFVEVVADVGWPTNQ